MDRLAREQRRRHAGRGKNLVGFVVADVRYAVDIHRVREIIRPLPLVGLPHPPPGVIGVIDHRSEVVPVVDLRHRFGLASQPPTRRTKWILVHAGNRTAGLVVDSVTEVFAGGEDDQRRAPAVADAARGISMVYGHAGTLVFVLDVDRIAASAMAVDVDLGSGTA